jgi:hypothetical protein
VQGTPRPPVRVIAPLLAGALLLCVLGIRGHIRRVEVERKAGQVASAIAGHGVKVNCPGPIKQRFSYEITEGRVRVSADGVPERKTNLSADACAGLRRVLDEGSSLNLECLYWNCSQADTQAAMGLIVLTHESVHMRGVLDEGLTECEAEKRVEATALAFGLTPQSAQSVAHWARTDYAELLPEQYRLCADSNAA